MAIPCGIKSTKPRENVASLLDNKVVLFCKQVKWGSSHQPPKTG